MVGDEAAILLEGGVEGGYIAESAKPLGMGGNTAPVQQGQQAGRAVPAPDAPDAVDRWVGKGTIQVGGPLGVVRGQIPMAVVGEAGGKDHGLQAQGAHTVHSAPQLLHADAGGGGRQRHPRAGEEGGGGAYGHIYHLNETA